MPKNSSSQLTALRLERTKLQGLLDKYTGNSRETRGNPIILPLNLKEEVFKIRKRISDINSQLSANCSRRITFSNKIDFVPTTLYSKNKMTSRTPPLNNNGEAGNISFEIPPIAPQQPYNPYLDNTVTNPDNINLDLFKRDTNEKKPAAAISLGASGDLTQNTVTKTKKTQQQNIATNVSQQSSISRDTPSQNELMDQLNRAFEEINQLRMDLNNQNNLMLGDLNTYIPKKSTGTIPKKLYLPLDDEPSDEYREFSPSKPNTNKPRFRFDSNREHTFPSTSSFPNHGQSFGTSSFCGEGRRNGWNFRENYISSNNSQLLTHNNLNNQERNRNLNFGPRNNSQNLFSENGCRRTFLNQLKFIPTFNGNSRTELTKFINTCDTLFRYIENESEWHEFLMVICVQLSGTARTTINDDSDWPIIKENLLSEFDYLTDQSTINSKIYNLKQENKESIREYAERSRKLLVEKNLCYNDLTQQQKLDHERDLREAFTRGIKNAILREKILSQDSESLKAAINYALRHENDQHNTYNKSELLCKFCKRIGHCESECNQKNHNNSEIGQLINAMKTLGFRANGNNQNSLRPNLYIPQKQPNSFPNFTRTQNNNFPNNNNNNFNPNYNQNNYPNNYNKNANNKPLNGNSSNNYPTRNQKFVASNNEHFVIQNDEQNNESFFPENNQFWHFQNSEN